MISLFADGRRPQQQLDARQALLCPLTTKDTQVCMPIWLAYSFASSVLCSGRTGSSSVGTLL